MPINKKAFTLVELLLVIAIVGILSGISVLGIKSARQRSRDAKRITDLNRVDAAIMQYYNVEKKYPDNIPGTTNYATNYDNLKNLTMPDPANPTGPQIPAFVPKYVSPLPADPGTNQYKYYNGGGSFALWVKMETDNRFAKASEDGGPSDNYYEIGNGDTWAQLPSLPGGEI